MISYSSTLTMMHGPINIGPKLSSAEERKSTGTVTGLKSEGYRKRLSHIARSAKETKSFVTNQ